MRRQSMDVELDEVFEQAEQGDARCLDFAKLWHRALAAATATSIHLDGLGKFFITGFNARFLNLTLLSDICHEMVKLSPPAGLFGGSGAERRIGNGDRRIGECATGFAEKLI